jgi:hypothetical protein
MTTLQFLVVVAVAVVVISIVRLRRRLALLAHQIETLRQHAVEPIRYRSVMAGALDAELAKATAEAEGQGFTILGDYVEESRLVPEGRPMRWFVDAAGTTFGWLAPFDVDGARHIVIVLMSHELDHQTITTRQPPASLLARPPFVTLQHVPVASSNAATLVRHRTKARFDDPERAFIPVKTFEQVQHELERMRGKVIEWRRAQPHGELLDADLRSLLGPQYDQLAAPLRRRLG